MAEFPFYEPERVLRRNLIPNPSFETLDGWEAVSGDLFLSTFHDRMWGGSGPGNKSLQANSDGSNSYLLVRPTESYIPVAPGQHVGVAALIAADTSGNAGVRVEIKFYGTETTGVSETRSSAPFYEGRLSTLVAQVPSTAGEAQIQFSMWSGESGVNLPEGKRIWLDGVRFFVADTAAEAEAAIATYFDGDTPDTDTIGYRWLPDGSSEEYTLEQNTGQLGGVAEVSASTDARLGIVSDVYSRSREKIQLKLAGVDDLVRSGHRIELAAAAMTSTPAVWHWRQVTGPTVALNARENTCDFIAPDVERSTRIRIGVYAASEDGTNRSDWHYFDLDVEPPMLRFRGGDDGDFSPRSPYLVGYSRGKREIWNDVIRPATYEKNPRHELEVVDLGVPDDDVVFSTETPRRMAAGGVWVNPETGDVFRNFGAGYNETDDTTASPRTSTYWVNPANGDILEWIED